MFGRKDDFSSDCSSTSFIEKLKHSTFGEGRKGGMAKYATITNITAQQRNGLAFLRVCWPCKPC